MRKKFLIMMLCIVMTYSFTACTNDDNLTEKQQSTTSDEQQSDEVADENSQAEENSEDSSGEGAETGNFKGLDVEDEIEIEVGDGESTAGG